MGRGSAGGITYKVDGYPLPIPPLLPEPPDRGTKTCRPGPEGEGEGLVRKGGLLFDL